MSPNTIFQRLGLTVVSVDKGVYHLRRLAEQDDPKRDLVGLLFSATPLDRQSPKVQLFLQEGSAETSAARIIYHWQTLDARRFEESGLEPQELDVAAEFIPETALEQRFTRPDGARVRHAVKLTTGEVVCYN
jgi:hypothetical protein